MIKDDCIFCDRVQDHNAHYYICDLDKLNEVYNPECKFCSYYLPNRVAMRIIRKLWRAIND